MYKVQLSNIGRQHDRFHIIQDLKYLFYLCFLPSTSRNLCSVKYLSWASGGSAVEESACKERNGVLIPG